MMARAAVATANAEHLAAPVWRGQRGRCAQCSPEQQAVADAGNDPAGYEHSQRGRDGARCDGGKAEDYGRDGASYLLPGW
jgi:hypothetical protein